MTNDLPSVTAVAVTKKPFVLRVKWDDGANTTIDLTGLVHRSRHFGIFREDIAAFRQVRVAPDGAGIAWDNGLDYSADTLKTLADEQRPMTGRDLQRFEEKNNLNAA